MLDLRTILDHPETVRRNLEIRLAGHELVTSVDEIVHLAGQRRQMLGELETLRRQRNELSQQIGRLRAAAPTHKGNGTVDDLTMEVLELKSRIADAERTLEQVENRVTAFMETLPNLLDETVPVGRSEADNPVVRTWGTPADFPFVPRDHKAIGEALGILDLPRGAGLTGSGFPVYRAAGARLERALIQFMLDLHTTEHGFTEYWVPFLVNRDTMRGTGQLPRFERDLYWAEGGALGLIPTAEVPLTNLHKGEILDQRALPLYLTAYSPCFRQEAGQHGEETRGLIRVHQFNKVELVKITTPETSAAELESLTRLAEEVLKRLDLPHRVICLCSADTGFAAARTYDVEVWLPSQGRYREISSCSNCTDFQARRMNLRYRRNMDRKTALVHTLNGSGVAVGRCWVALIENYQQADGSVIIPPVLRPYMGGLDRLTPALPTEREVSATFDGRKG